MRVYAHTPPLSSEITQKLPVVLQLQLLGAIVMTSYYIEKQGGTDAMEASWQYLYIACSIWAISWFVLTPRQCACCFSSVGHEFVNEELSVGDKQTDKPYPKTPEERKRLEGNHVKKGAWTYAVPTPTILWGGSIKDGIKVENTDDALMRESVMKHSTVM